MKYYFSVSQSAAWFILFLISTWFSIVFICFKCWFPKTLVTISNSINQDLQVIARSQVGIFWTLMSVHRHTYGELNFACIWGSKVDCRWLFVQTQRGSGGSVRTWVLSLGFLVFLSHQGIKHLRSRCAAAVKISRRGRVWFMWWGQDYSSSHVLFCRTMTRIIMTCQTQALSCSSLIDSERWCVGKTSSLGGQPRTKIWSEHSERWSGSSGLKVNKKHAKGWLLHSPTLAPLVSSGNCFIYLYLTYCLHSYWIHSES